MEHFRNGFRDEIDAKTADGQIFIKDSVRISIITSRLLRVEYQPDKKFCDMPTQAIFNRNFDKAEFITSVNGNRITVKTNDALFVVSEQGEMLSVTIGNKSIADFKSGNLKGTRRTLDMTKGTVPLEDGILSRDGVSITDDSETLIISENGKAVPRDEYLNRSENGTDKYIFAYGHDYRAALRDFYKLCGKTPLIPRFALGNWWSRYKAYTQNEYLDLMRRFKAEEIPITVATIDMDWHWVNIKKQFGKEALEYCKDDKKIDGIKNKLMALFQSAGWTGYSWNTELFPDYKEFLKTLKNEGYTVTVNLHPCDGVRFFEDMYDEFARFMGMNPSEKKIIRFDISDDKFTEGYFKFLHNKYEDKGVDFWWIDWQQGTSSSVKGLDPLWWLNHYHSLDIARNGKRPLILSRYAGVGSHRYPLGFSGDTAVTWSALKFQPYFTSTASNAGYTWWSHDIGGHTMGSKDDELYIRWLQLGVFSPIMRLHSTSNEFAGKEPWKLSGSTCKNATELLKLRHRLIPYIYTMNMLTHRDGRPLIEPMYYEHPEADEAYKVPNEYRFGTELIAAPITEKASRKTLMASCEVWFPEGRFTDIFTGRIYSGNKKITINRDSSLIPVFAKEGAIIPLSVNDTANDWKNPDDMQLLIYRGNGEFTLYEDDGETLNYKNGAFAQTKYTVTENGTDVTFKIDSASGDLSVIPEKRRYTLSFRDIVNAKKIIAKAEEADIEIAICTKCGTLEICMELSASDSFTITLENITAAKNPDKTELLTELLSKVQGNNNLKMLLYTRYVKDYKNKPLFAGKNIKKAADEIEAMD